MEKRVSFYKNFGGQSEEVDLNFMLGAIKEGAYREQIQALRKLNEKEYGEAKQRLPHFTPSGTFNEKRRSENLSVYSQIMVLDIDDVGEVAVKIRNKSAEIEYTLAAFLSPGGQGVKILVNTDSTAECHKLTFNQIVRYYEKQLNVKVDTSGKDISRACFVSWDPEMYINENCNQYHVTFTEVPEFKEVSSTLDSGNFQYVVDFTDKIYLYFHGNRHNYIYLLANNCNRAGIEKQNAESLIMSHYNDSDMKNDIPNAIKSAYSHTSEHGSLSINYMYSASSARSASTAERTSLKTPIISEDIHKNLPNLLKRGIDAFELAREKDVFLTGALVVLSGCFPSVQGLYEHSIVYPNLNGFIIAPPSSGKGKLIFSRNLANEIHNDIRAKYKMNSSFEDEEDRKKLPVSLFIPADSSSAAVKESLEANLGVGIICETEADTLSATLKQDWGGYSDIIRKATHHEPVTYSRKGKDEPVRISEIQCPKISVCLSGTPNQVSGLLKSTEDGLFSRILFYTYRNEGTPFFKNVFSHDGIQNHTEFFKTLAEAVYYNYNQLKIKGKVEFKLTSNQEQKFIPYFDKKVKKMSKEYGEESDVRSIINRLGLFTFRIAMILTVLRNFDKNFSDKLICSDIDYKTSLQLSEIYLEHALAVYESLPGTVSIKQNVKHLYEFLPEQFEAKKAIHIGKTICGYGERSISNYLSELKDIGWLKQPRTNGLYIKHDLQ